MIGVYMSTVISGHGGTAPIYAVRERKRDGVIKLLSEDAERMRQHDANLRLWLIGSFATGTWDAYSDVDVVCVSSIRYGETDFLTSDHYTMDIFSLSEVEFNRRIGSSDVFQQAIKNGVSL